MGEGSCIGSSIARAARLCRPLQPAARGLHTQTSPRRHAGGQRAQPPLSQSRPQHASGAARKSRAFVISTSMAWGALGPPQARCSPQSCAGLAPPLTRTLPTPAPPQQPQGLPGRAAVLQQRLVHHHHGDGPLPARDACARRLVRTAGRLPGCCARALLRRRRAALLPALCASKHSSTAGTAGHVLVVHTPPTPKGLAMPFKQTTDTHTHAPQTTQKQKRSIDQFVVAKKLGGGYASTVHLAICKATGTQVAVKVYHRCKLSQLNHYQVFVLLLCCSLCCACAPAAPSSDFDDPPVKKSPPLLANFPPSCTQHTPLTKHTTTTKQKKQK